MRYRTRGVSLSYSKRLSRPRGRFLDPTPNISSNINIFRNPDLDPSLTDKFDVGYINRWDKVTLIHRCTLKILKCILICKI
jgi:outer membrane receptor protein involved in Fe transport